MVPFISLPAKVMITFPEANGMMFIHQPTKHLNDLIIAFFGFVFVIESGPGYFYSPTGLTYTEIILTN
jgi:hypothetical protein